MQYTVVFDLQLIEKVLGGEKGEGGRAKSADNKLRHVLPRNLAESYPQNMYPDRRESTPLSSASEKTFEHQSSCRQYWELLYSGLIVCTVARFPGDFKANFSNPLFGTYFSSGFGSKLGFKTGLLNIIFKLNHVCNAENSRYLSLNPWLGSQSWQQCTQITQSTAVPNAADRSSGVQKPLQLVTRRGYFPFFKGTYTLIATYKSSLISSS